MDDSTPSGAPAASPPGGAGMPSAGVPAGSSTAPPPTSEQTVLLQMMQMMSVQQQVMQQHQQQFQAFLEHQARVQNEIFEKQARASRQRSKVEPPKFNGTAKEDLELCLFQIEEHFSSYAAERDSNDSRFVDLVVPYLGTNVMYWYREFKQTLGDSPRTWCVFKHQLHVRFRDSDFEFKLMSLLYDLRATGSQQEYTAKFMLLLSQSSLELPEMMKRWFYQQNLRPETSTHISQNVPATLQQTIEHAQRFEDARKPATSKDKTTGPSRGSTSKPTPTSDDSRKSKPQRRHDPDFIKNATCHMCGEKGHIAPDCPEKGKPRAAKN